MSFVWLAWLGTAGAVVGGTADDAADYPAVVLLTSDTPDAPVCSGTLVGPAWVLTAAHCAGLQQVHIGGARAPFRTTRRVAEVRLHPDYAPGVDPFDADEDIALLRLDAPVRGVRPMPLITGAVGPDWVGRSLRLVGFGATRDRGTDDSVRRHALSTVSVVDPLNVRAYTGAANACGGDSGGAALVETGRGSVLVGVLVFAVPGCVGGSTGAARIDRHRAWIRSIVPAASPSRCGCGGPGGGAGLAFVLLALATRRRP